MAGRIQILTRGYAGEYLTTNPDFTYFNNRYAKYTNFSKESFSLKPENLKEVSTGDTVNFRIPIKRGDLLNGLSVSFTIPENLDDLNPSMGDLDDYFIETFPDAAGPQLTPIDNFGISVIEHVELYIGDQLLDRITSDDIFIYTQTREPRSHEDTHKFLYGDDFINEITSYPSNYFNKVFSGQFARTREAYQNYRGTKARYDSVPYTIYNVQIPFYFHRRPEYGFPLCAIEYQELEIRIKLRNGRNVLFPTFYSTTAVLSGGGLPEEPLILWNYKVDDRTQNFSLSNFKLNIDVTYLDAPERLKLKYQTRDILIEQRQHNNFTMEGGVKNKKFRLDFKNCVKEIYFLARKKLDLTNTQIGTIYKLYYSLLKDTSGSGVWDDSSYNYNIDRYSGGKYAITHQQKPVPCIYMKQEVTTLTCDNVPILDEVTGSDQFLMTALPDLHNTRTPNNKNIMMYSFALHPDKLEPSGHLNFSTIKNVIVDMTLYYDGTIGAYDVDGNYIEDYWDGYEEGYVAPRDVVKDIIVTAKSYNVLRFENGAAKLLF